LILALKWLVRGLVAVLAIFIGVQAWFLAHIVYYKHRAPGSTAFMSYRLEELRRQNPNATIRYRFVPYAKISVHLKRAMIAAEDAKFVDHEGFDWNGIQIALDKNWRRGRTVAGGSTISQQLAKNLFLSPDRSWARKAEEAMITVMIESTLDKERILELYLNVIEWGSGVFGAEAAAQRYFGIPASGLSADHAARLAAMAPNPRFYERNPDARGLLAKIGIIRERMSAAELP